MIALSSYEYATAETIKVRDLLVLDHSPTPEGEAKEREIIDFDHANRQGHSVARQIEAWIHETKPVAAVIYHPAPRYRTEEGEERVLPVGYANVDVFLEGWDRPLSYWRKEYLRIIRRTT